MRHKMKKLRWIGIIIFILILAGCTTKKDIPPDQTVIDNTPQAPPPPPKISVHFIDVGFGEAILIKTPNKNALIDCGPDDQTIVNYLKEQGVTELAFLIGTHKNEENIGGCDGVLKNINVKEYFDNGEKSGTPAYIDVMYEVDKKKHRALKEGDVLDLDVAKLTVINPKILSLNSNFNSLVLKLNYNNIDMLFTGDCTEDCERALLYKKIGQVDVLKVARYCDDKSTLNEFIRELKPKVAVLFADVNEFDYPDFDCVKRITDERVVLLRTDLEKTIVLETDGSSVQQTGSSLMWS